MLILSMVLGGFFFLVDARVGAAVKRSDALVSQLADGPNNLYVQLREFDIRLAELEKMPPKSPFKSPPKDKVK
jgi:hypothetical protein